MKTITQELLDGLKNADDIKAFLDLHEQDFLSQSLIDYLNELMNEKNITVASMRADVIFGAVFNESRESIKQLINAEKASVNWLPLKSVSAQLNEGDVLSLKGSGRGVLISVNGETKKGRISIKIGKYV